MMADLTPRIRACAMRAAIEAKQRYDNTELSPNDDERWGAIVDAVASVLGPYWEAQQREFEYERDMGDDL